MKIMFKFIIFSLITGFFSCGDQNPIIDPPPIEKITIFDLQWSSRLEESKEVVGTDFTQFYKDWVLISGDIDDPFTLFGFNKNTGAKDWTFSNDGLVNDEILTSKIYQNVYIAITNKGMVAVDLDLQERKWEIPFSSLGYESDKGNYVHNGFLYHNFSIGGVGLDSDAAAIVRINLTNGSYEEIYRLENDSIGLKSFSPPIVTNVNSEAIMCFNIYPDAEKAPQEDSQNLIAFNITQNKVEWNIENFTQNYYSNSLHPPIIYNDIVITGGDWSIYAFDINTGQQLWRFQVPGYDQFGIWTTTNHLIHNDRLYVNPGGHPIICLNPIDGSVIWENLEDAPNCTDNMIYYEKEDYLVYTSWGLGSVMIIDALTGELVHRERSEDSTFNNDPVYDPETDMFFTSTYKHAIGFKINRPE